MTTVTVEDLVKSLSDDVGTMRTRVRKYLAASREDNRTIEALQHKQREIFGVLSNVLDELDGFDTRLTAVHAAAAASSASSAAPPAPAGSTGGGGTAP